MGANSPLVLPSSHEVHNAIKQVKKLLELAKVSEFLDQMIMRPVTSSGYRTCGSFIRGFEPK